MHYTTLNLLTNRVYYPSLRIYSFLIKFRLSIINICTSPSSYVCEIKMEKLCFHIPITFNNANRYEFYNKAVCE